MNRKKSNLTVFRKAKRNGIPLAEALDIATNASQAQAKKDGWRLSELATHIAALEEDAAIVYGTRALAKYRADRDATRRAIAKTGAE